MTLSLPNETRTVTLSDGSVWTYDPEWKKRYPPPTDQPHLHNLPSPQTPWLLHLANGQFERFVNPRTAFGSLSLTASDHRAIADVLDPPEPAFDPWMHQAMNHCLATHTITGLRPCDDCKRKTPHPEKRT